MAAGIAMRATVMAAVASCCAAACGGAAQHHGPVPVGYARTSSVPTLMRPTYLLDVTPVARFVAPWALAPLPDGGLIVTDNATAQAYVVSAAGAVSPPIGGLPDNRTGLFDVKLDPDYARTHRVYLSYPEIGGPGTPRLGRQALDPTMIPVRLSVVAAELVVDAAGVARFENLAVIWTQTPFICSVGEFGGRLAFSPDGRYLYIAAGDRQEFDPVQDLSNTLGKMVRLYKDGTIPADNPFVGTPGAMREIWTLGHRNPYGLIFSVDGQLWSHEHGPKGGDELNLIQPGLNYGWPRVSYGDHYAGLAIPRPAPGDGNIPPVRHWTPSIAPAGFILYGGGAFAQWAGDGLATGLQSRGLVRIRFGAADAVEMERIPMDARVRDLAEGPGGLLWIVEDAPSARLLRVLPLPVPADYKVPPTVTLQAPLNDGDVSGVIPVVASFGSVRPGVPVRLTVSFAGTVIFTATSSPLVGTFDVSSTMPGRYPVTATVTDGDGVTTGVTVMVHVPTPAH